MIRRLEKHLKRLVFALLKLLMGSGQPADLATKSFRRILVIRQHDQLGDMLCVVPLLRALRGHYHEASIAVMTSPVNHHVMLHNPYVNCILNYDKREFLGDASVKLVSFLKFVGRLRKEEFELAIVPSTVSVSATSDLLAFLCGAKYRIGAGTIDGDDNPSGVLFNCPVNLNWRGSEHRHQALRNLDIAQALHLHVADYSSEIRLGAEEIREAKDVISGLSLQAGSFISFHPGAGKPPNRWPAENFARLANRILEGSPFGALITHGPMDDEPVRKMISNLTVHCNIVANRSIRQVAAILSLARLVVSNDTGIMHVAAAVGTPVLSLFGPTDPEQWAPIGTKHRYIVGKGGEIGSIGVEEVLAVTREMLREQTPWERIS